VSVEQTDVLASLPVTKGEKPLKAWQKAVLALAVVLVCSLIPLKANEQQLTTDLKQAGAQSEMALLQAQNQQLKMEVDKWAWRGKIEYVGQIISSKQNMGWSQTRELARAFAKVSDEHQIPLMIGPAIACVESNFNQSAVGKHGEKSLMQIWPWKGRPIKDIEESPGYAIRWALENCFLPGFQSCQSPNLDDKILAGLRYYNNDSNAYAKKVFAVYQQFEQIAKS